METAYNRDRCLKCGQLEHIEYVKNGICHKDVCRALRVERVFFRVYQYQMVLVGILIFLIEAYIMGDFIHGINAYSRLYTHKPNILLYYCVGMGMIMLPYVIFLVTNKKLLALRQKKFLKQETAHHIVLKISKEKSLPLPKI